MMPFNKCPICGGEAIKKEVEKLLKGGSDTVEMVNCNTCMMVNRNTSVMVSRNTSVVVSGNA
jgi:uncharacterized Zn finger protein